MFVMDDDWNRLGQGMNLIPILFLKKSPWNIWCFDDFTIQFHSLDSDPWMQIQCNETCESYI